jgi:transcriptional repressor NrdR
MDALKGLDAVAYVRFASVYRDFREAADFQDVLTEIARSTDPDDEPPRNPGTPSKS